MEHRAAKWMWVMLLLGAGHSTQVLAQAGAPVQVAAAQLRDPGKLVAQYEQGRVLAFDMAAPESKEEKRALMSEISGMAIGDNKMVYLRKGPQGTRFLVLEKNIRPEKQAQALEKFSREDATRH